MFIKQVLYVASTMHETDFFDVFTDRKNMPGQQAQKYHRLMIEGLAANDINVKVVSGVPITKKNYDNKVFNKKDRKDGKVTYHYLTVFNHRIIKKIMQVAGSFFSVLKVSGGKSTIVVCDVLNASVSRGAIIAAKLKKIPCVGIITDMPDMMVTGGSNRYTNVVNKNINDCTHYVFLTEQMNEVLNTNKKPYTIIEGLCDINMGNIDRKDKKDDSIKRCMYAGLIDSRYGVKKMVDAFVQAKIDNAVLDIYGSGPYVEELKELADTNKNVIYHGSVPIEDVVKAELEATILINPRPSDEEFTKYSFPSKNMEYMASGTPLLTTDLPGMPEEYKDFVYLFEDEKVEGMIDTLRDILNTDLKQLEYKGIRAKKFVINYKNNIIQSKNIIDLVNKGD